MKQLRVLILHSRYLSGALSGETRVVEDEAALLEAAGHEVEILSPSPDRLSKRALAARTLSSHDIARDVRGRVRSQGVDVVHGHNLFPAIGPGALTAARDAGAAVVLTLHNYRLLCLAGTFRRGGQVCEVCLGRAPWRGVVHRCYRGSTAQSAVLAASLVTHRARDTFDAVHRFLAVSEFVRAKHLEAGLPPERVVVKPNVVLASERRKGPGSYFLVLGRLSSEKGVGPLVRSWRPALGELLIVGDGPEREEIAELAPAHGAVLRESVPPEAVQRILAGARALMLPSLSHEGQPRVVLEAYAAGVPVIAHAVGAIDELVRDGETGLVVPVGSEPAWHEAVNRLTDDAVSERLGDGAYRLWSEHFSPGKGLVALEGAYRAALSERR